MPQVKSEIEVDASPETCYEIASNMEQFPEFMQNVNQVKVLEEGENWTVTRWDSKFQGQNISWTEEDVFDDEELTIEYDQTEGDLKVFRGQWKFTPKDTGCLITLTVQASLGVPMLQAALDPLVKKVVKDNCNQMLEGIKEKAESET